MNKKKDARESLWITRDVSLATYCGGAPRATAEDLRLFPGGTAVPGGIGCEGIVVDNRPRRRSLYTAALLMYLRGRNRCEKEAL